MKIAIMGAGSLGTIIGAFITEGNESVDLIDVNKKHIRALNEKGATITGTIEKNVDVKAIHPDEMEGQYDLILLLTKQYFNDTVLTQLQPHMHDESVICSLQNGVPEESIAKVVGKERVIAGSVEFGATFVEPGVSKLTSEFPEVEKLAFMIGELHGKQTRRLEKIKTILDHVGTTVITDNLMGTKWSKLVINASMSGLSAALNCTYGDIAHDDRLLEFAIRIIDETVQVGHEKGIHFVPVFDLNFNEFLVSKNNIENLMQSFKEVILPHSLLKASMLQDLEKGNRTEINDINGEITEGSPTIPTPFNDLIVGLVSEAEQKKSVPHFKTNVKKVIALIEQYN